AMTMGAVVMDRCYAGRVRHLGSDALDLLNRFSTNNTVEMEDGEVRGTVITSDKGRVAEFLFAARWTLTEALLLTSPQNRQKVIDWLDLYNFGEDSELEDVTESTAQIDLVGPEAGSVLEAVGVAPSEPMRAERARIAGKEVSIVRTDWPGLPCWNVVVEEQRGADVVWDALIEAGASPAGESAYEVVRIERGIPVYGRELSEEVNPLEANLMPFISWDKGCYMGQEVVARLDTYDKVRKRLVGLRSDTPISAGDDLRDGGRKIGTVTSAVYSPRLGRYVALGFVRREHAAPGAALETEHGTAEVTDLAVTGAVPA
ncbi:MAG: glycine cleavage T C-terminal barrel domain-containing protein, partial [Chloroflexota bacterium]